MGGRRISELFYELRANTEGLKKDLDDGQRQLGKFSQFVANNPTAVAGALATALVGVGIEAAHMAEEVDAASRRIVVSMPRGAASVREVEEAVRRVSDETGRLDGETRSLFETISKEGVASAQEIEQRARAIEKFADATNSDRQATAAGLDQIMDAFHLAGDQAESALAKVASVSEGRQDVLGLLQALQAAAPAVAKYKIDFETTLKALVGIMDTQGFDPGQAGKLLKTLDAEGIREYAKRATIAADATQRLTERADLAREGLDRLSSKTKNDLSRAMVELGEKVLPLVVEELKGINGVLSLIDGTVARIRSNTNIGTIGTLGRQNHLSDDARQRLRDAVEDVPADIANGSIDLESKSLAELKSFYGDLLAGVKQLGLENDKVFRGILTSTAALIAEKQKLAATETTTGTSGSGGRTTPLTREEKQAAEAAIADVEKSVNEFGVAVQKTIAGTTKSAVDNAVAEYQALGLKIQEVRAEIAKKAKLPGVDPAEIQAQVAQLKQFAEQALAAQRDVIQRVTLEERASIRNNVEAALASATGSAAAIARQALEQQTTALLKQIDATKVLDETEKRRLATIVVTTDQLERQAIEAKASAERVAAIGAQLDVAQAGGRLPPGGSVNALNAAALNVAQKMRELEAKGLTDSQAYRDYQKQIVDLETRRREIVQRIVDANAVDLSQQEKKTAEIRAQAYALQQAVDGAVQLAEAFGLVGHETADVLRSVGQIAAGIGPLKDALKIYRSGGGSLGSVIGAALPIAGGIASLISATGIFGNAEEDAARRKTLAENTLALQHLTEKVGLLGSVSLSGQQSTEAVTAAQHLLSAGLNDSSLTKSTFAITKLTADEADAFKKAAQEYGIALDGSVDSIRKVVQAILAGAGKLGEFGDDFDSFTKQAEAARKIFGTDNPAQHLTDLATAATKASPAIAKLFEGLDLTKPADLETLRQRVQDLFKVMEAGGQQLSEADLGSLTGDQLVQFLENIIDGIGALTPAAQSAADKLSAARQQLSTEFEILGTDAGGQLQRIAQVYSANGGALADLVKDLDLTTAEGAETLRQRIVALFQTLQDPNNTVDLAGLSLEQLLAALLDLKNGADAVAGGILSAAQQMSAAADALKTDFEVYGTDPVGQVTQLAKLYAGVGGIGNALAGLDLSSVAGRGAAITALQQLYGSDKSNKDQTDAILELLRALRAVPQDQAASGAADPNTQTSGAERITIEQADRLISLTETLVVFGRQTAQNTRALAAFLQPAAYAPVQAPLLPSAFVGGAGGGAQITVRLTVINHFMGPIGKGVDGDALGKQLGEGASDVLDIALGNSLQRWDQVRGSPFARVGV